MKLQIACAKCKKILGNYEGEQFWIYPALPPYTPLSSTMVKKQSILCKSCLKEKKKQP